MANIKGDHWLFYLEGHDERLMRHDISVDDIADRLIESGGDVREAAATACAAVVRPLEEGRTKTRWLQEHEHQIKEIGGDPELAYAGWLAGRRDALIETLEPAILEALGDRLDDGDGEGEDEDED